MLVVACVQVWAPACSAAAPPPHLKFSRPKQCEPVWLEGGEVSATKREKALQSSHLDAAI